MLVAPATGKTVLQRAAPAWSATAVQPEIGVDPAVNETVPPDGAGETVATRMTWPRTGVGFAELHRDVAVAVSTGWVRVVELLGANAAAPEYAAWIVWAPAVAYVTVHFATPPCPMGCAVQLEIGLPPSLNATV